MISCVLYARRGEWWGSSRNAQIRQISTGRCGFDLVGQIGEFFDFGLISRFGVIVGALGLNNQRFQSLIGWPFAKHFGGLRALIDQKSYVVWKLDRLGRSVRQVLDTFEFLSRRGVEVRVITQPGLDTSTAMGRLIITIMAAVAEMEKNLINERTAAGLKAARAAGRIGGRKETYTDEQIAKVMHLGPVKGAKSLGMSKTQFIRRVDRLKEKEKAANAKP